MPTAIKVNLMQVAASCFSKRLVARSRLSASCVRAGHMISLFALELHHRLCRRGRIIPMPNRGRTILMLPRGCKILMPNRGRTILMLLLMLLRGRKILMHSLEPMMRYCPNLVKPSQGTNQTPNGDKQEDIWRAVLPVTPERSEGSG